MSEDEYGTRVIFKQDRGEVMAFLLDVPSNYGRVVCYAHVGQHSEADINYARWCKPARPEQYKALQEELESLGYVLTIRRKFPSGFVRGYTGIRIP